MDGFQTMTDGTDQNSLGKVFCGTVIHSTSSAGVEIREHSVIGVKDGKVLFLEDESHLNELLHSHEIEKECVQRLSGRQFLIPGFVDCHIHSPQLPIQAVGTDLGLLAWLKKYTFPTEMKFESEDFAAQAHEKTVIRTLRNGTTAAAYYSTIHWKSTLLLCEAADRWGQRALVGKVNMDILAPDGYRETTQQSLEDTKRFLDELSKRKFPLVTPVITPRFAASCSKPLMEELASLAKDKNLPVQTHMDESLEEIEAVLKLHPGHSTYTDVYDATGLLGSKTILGHCVHISDKELDILKARGCGVCHCACSNISLHSGIMDLRRILNWGLKVGLGTDVAGGYSPCMLSAMQLAVATSNICAMQHGNQIKSHHTQNDWQNNHHSKQVPYRPITMYEAFQLATLGGSSVLGLNCGNFEVGREFDALVIDPEVDNTPLDIFTFDTAENIFQKFLYTGDDRNIIEVYVHGKQVMPKSSL